MRILIDTNVVLDFLSVNEGFENDAAQIFELAVENKAVELVSASAITDLYYVLRKRYQSTEEAQDKLENLRKYLHVLPVTESDIDRAMRRRWKDFEDAVQYTVAETNHVDYIITRDRKGYEESAIPVMAPKEFIEKIITEI